MCLSSVIFFKTMYNLTIIIRFDFCDILNNPGLDKCYQPRPSARLITLASTLIISDITKTSSNNCLISGMLFPGEGNPIGAQLFESRITRSTGWFLSSGLAGGWRYPTFEQLGRVPFKKKIACVQPAPALWKIFNPKGRGYKNTRIKPLS